VANLELVELLDQGAGLLVQRDQVVGADVVLAADLADDELGVALGDDLRVPLLEGALQAADQRGVLGLVVGGFADVLVTLDAVAVRENAIADTGRPGVAARRAVELDDRGHTGTLFRRRKYFTVFARRRQIPSSVIARRERGTVRPARRLPGAVVGQGPVRART